jgi:putative transposase
MVRAKKTLQTEQVRSRSWFRVIVRGSFEPQIVGKHERYISGFGDEILSMYARGMTVSDVQGHLQEIYSVEVSSDLISKVTDAVMDEQRAWQKRPLEPVCLIVYIGALVTKIRDKGVVHNKAVHAVMGIAPDGRKDILGFWVQTAKGAKLWLSIFGELRQGGVQDTWCCSRTG